MKLGEALIKESLITRDQLKAALERQVVFGGRIGTNIVELGFIKEYDFVQFLSRFHKVPALDPSKLLNVDGETIACISKEIAEKYKVIPFLKDRNRLHVAVLDPRSFTSIDELRFVSGYDIVPHVTSELRFLLALEKYYGTERDLRFISILDKSPEDKKPGDSKKEHLIKVKESFASAREKEEIIGILLTETMSVATRAAFFVLKGNTLSGWKSRNIPVEGVQITPQPSSIFSDVIGSRAYFRGPLLNIPGNQQLISLLSGAPQDCLMIPLVIRDKIIGLMYADNGNSAVMDAGLNYINMLMSMASISFEILILRKKILDL